MVECLASHGPSTSTLSEAQRPSKKESGKDGRRAIVWRGVLQKDVSGNDIVCIHEATVNVDNYTRLD